VDFHRSELNDSVAALIRSTDVYERAIGSNFRIEENVADARRHHVECFEPALNDIRALANAYFEGSIQGVSRRHLPSTFDVSLNGDALLSLTIDPNQKIVRLERIDDAMHAATLDFLRLKKALAPPDADELSTLTDIFATYRGARPAFAAFKSEVEPDLAAPDWLTRLIDRMGLLHHYPHEDGNSYSFALMEYTAAEVIAQAAPQGITHSFALATVLECRNNPAFFPVPKAAANGFTVDLRARSPALSLVREILHARIDYSWKHVKRLEQWTGAPVPDIEAARERHRTVLRRETGRPDFGEVS
jgi:hypothetical protein